MLPAELQSSVRSLRRWSLSASVMLVAFLTLWLCLIVINSLSVFATFDTGLDDGLAVHITMKAIGSGIFASILSGVPAWMLWLSHRWAAEAAITERVQPLVRSIVWLRRFVVSTAVSALLFIAGIILITAIDLVQFFNV